MLIVVLAPDEAELDLEKHLAGRHDQKSHGFRGRHAGQTNEPAKPSGGAAGEATVPADPEATKPGTIARPRIDTNLPIERLPNNRHSSTIASNSSLPSAGELEASMKRYNPSRPGENIYYYESTVKGKRYFMKYVHDTEREGFAAREAAISDMAKRAGLEQHIPKSGEVEIKGRRFIVTEFLEGSTPIADLGNYQAVMMRVPRSIRTNGMLFDFVTAQRDRHLGNLTYDGVRGRFHMPDNERAFTNKRDAGHWNETGWRRGSPDLQSNVATIPRSQIQRHVRNSKEYERIAEERGQDASIIRRRTQFLREVLRVHKGDPNFEQLDALFQSWLHE